MDITTIITNLIEQSIIAALLIIVLYLFLRQINDERKSYRENLKTLEEDVKYIKNEVGKIRDNMDGMENKIGIIPQSINEINNVLIRIQALIEIWKR